MYPPVYFLIALAIMVAMGVYFPLLTVTSLLLEITGVILIVLGVALALKATTLFRSYRTTVRPDHDVTVLVTSGIYRWSRNPMYTGMLLALVGILCLLGGLTPVLAIFWFAWIIQKRFINPEEKRLQSAFGPEYETYCRRVRRWL